MNMDTKIIKIVYKTLTGNVYYKNKIKEEKMMLKLVAKIAEKYAQTTNTACIIFGMFHQPKMPASLIKKD